MSEMFGVAALLLQAISLSGVWVEIFSPQARSGKPPMAKTVLILSILSGSFYFSAGFAEAEPDWIKAAYGGASVITCGTNLSQWYFRWSLRSILGVLLVEAIGLIMLAIGAGAVAATYSGSEGLSVLNQFAFLFLVSQTCGRIIQIHRFLKVRPEGASLLLWSANVTLNGCMIAYHGLRGEGSWVAANAISAVFGVVVLLQIASYRRARRTRHVTTQARVNTCTHQDVPCSCDDSVTC